METNFKVPVDIYIHFIPPNERCILFYWQGLIWLISDLYIAAMSKLFPENDKIEE